MKVGYLLIVLLTLWSTGSACLAQSKKNDLLVKVDNTRIQCWVISVDAAVIRYRYVNGKTILRINKNLVSRIIYANGKVSVIKLQSKPTIQHNPGDIGSEPPSTYVTANNPDSQSKQESELDVILQDIEKDKSVNGRKIRLHPILFEIGSNKVQPQSFAYLDSIALFLAKIPTITVEISGYTDNTGNASANYQLSQSRANAVRAYLVNVKKLAASRLQATGYGQIAPIATNNTEQGRLLNRRVELRFLGQSNEVYIIQLKNGRRVSVTFVVSSADNKTVSYRENANAPLLKVPTDNIEFIEYPDGSRRPIGSTELLFDDKKPKESDKNQTLVLSAKKFSIQLNGLPNFMLGSAVWTSLSNGYGHTIGIGGSVQFDYWLIKQISIGAELGYLAWNTQVDLVEKRDGSSYYTYYTKTGQCFLLAHVRARLGNHVYLMPQGGISQLQVTLNDATERISFSGTQTNFGGALGFLIPLSRTINLDAGLFYRTTIGSKTLKMSYGLEPMQYVGIRLGVGFSQ